MVHIPHSQLAASVGLLLRAPHRNLKPQAAHSLGFLGPSSIPVMGEIVIKWCLSLQLLEELLCPYLTQS